MSEAQYSEEERSLEKWFDDPDVKQALLGDEVRGEINASKTLQAVLRLAEQDAQTALEQLAITDVADRDALLRAQLRYHTARSLPGYVNYLINAAKEAEKRAEQDSFPD